MATATDPIVDQQGQVPDPPQGDQDSAQPDYGDWNERLPDDLIKVMVDMAKRVCDEFRYPRRLEVMKDWQGRSFWRELQHLKWNWDNEGWDLALGPGAFQQGQDSSRDSAVMYTTNMYQGFGDAFIAIITQSVPSLRWEPEDPDDPADVETSKAAESYRKIVQRDNDPIELMTKAAYHGWIGGRLHGWTRWEVDPRTKQPREMQDVFGSMECKVPVIYNKMGDYPYLQFSKEYHQSTVRAKVKNRDFEDKDYWKKIKGGSHGNGQDIYERTARISIMQGISMRSAGGDAYAHLVTTQRTWFRPTIFYEEKIEDKYRDTLIELFPHGMYIEVDNGTYTGSRDACMDDEWAVDNVMEGDGAFRTGKGSCLISVQERANDIINITQDVYEKTQPASHWDDKLFDIDAFKRQISVPGAKYGLDISALPPGDMIANHVFFETPATVSPDMLGYLKELMTDIPEFLTGVSAVLFGSDTSGDKSGKALQIQQSAAMGRIGLPFRVMKRFYARMMEQALRCSARNRTSDMKKGIPDNKGEIETIQVRIESLQGNVRCYPDSDENYPETWVQKRSTYMQLMMEGATDPAMKAILMHPKNMVLGKKLIGLDLEIPTADSEAKQMAEINIMLTETPPQPEPQPPQQVPNPMLPTEMETIQPPPTQSSSVQVDKDYDDHAAEFATVQAWINSGTGQKAKKDNPLGFENVRIHGLQHKALIAPPPGVPVPPGKV